ncbi:MAG: ECF transporter S component [Defluviitoga tunisiensis]|uniref:Putative membrane protein n=1 Tax=Defluviitoga tunisiensis TaxID=1006576 RepID=A0A0C7NIE8_DEFTU|nr:ECF transporter S component [Defluviitoga tunisiensis]MDD3600618.1 ECF transporter S component [Defluviitoga tunisiensis]MDY0379479.1 ECF transporter S component [Defluviitoga tunisiensis]CEP77731.1 putative membrane protein [Defluviitoga tunisiensis]HOB55509.1 ECF transporter S component [Defluviitoga tunisiensis]HOK16153.1 ECF transporter S component [Defluviitoga tunisiensis]
MKSKNKRLVTISLLSAISFILGFTPLGFIPIPPANATTMHIPVVIGAILEGPIAGMVIGLIFGISSIIQALLRPNILSFAFINPLVSVLPRILIGLVSYYSYKLVFNLFSSRKNGEVSKGADSISVGISAALGTLTNTVGVLGMMYLLYAGRIAEAMEIKKEAVGGVILAIGLTNGIPEIIIAVLITIAVIRAVKKAGY